MSAIEDLLNHEATETQAVDPAIIIRKLATNKDLRIFLTAITRYSKADWAALIKNCRLLYDIAQSSLISSKNDNMMKELVKYPHIAAFAQRMANE